MAWASEADALAVAGVVIDEATLSRASSIVEVAVGRGEADVDETASADLRRLMLATAYQAAWLAAHPEALTEADAASTSVEGHSQSLRDSAALWLAPLARAALTHLSWMGVRSVSESLAPETDTPAPELG